MLSNPITRPLYTPPPPKPLTMELDPNNITNPIFRATEQSNRTLSSATTINLSPEGMRHLEISMEFNRVLNEMNASGENTGSRINDLSIAFGMLYQQFTPAVNTPVSAESRFIAGESFTRGEVIFYDNRHWEILQDFTHNGDQNWRPGLAHSLFRETAAETQPQSYCPILHSVFSGNVRFAFGMEAVHGRGELNQSGARFIDYGACENVNILFRNTVLNLPQEVEEAWKRSQEQAEIFIEKFLQNVYTQGHVTAFNMAMQAIQ